MPAIVLVGAQWGDEGKGKATDLLGSAVDYVVTWDLPAREPIAKKLWRHYDGVHSRGKACVFRVKDEYQNPAP